MMLVGIMFLMACEKDESDEKLYFLGDSMVANWDVEASFPNRITENLGVDGIGIATLDASVVKDNHAASVVLIGTNDLSANMSEEKLTAYCEDYLRTIAGIPSGKVVLISVLPTNNKPKNEVIQAFNERVEKRIADYAKMVFVDCYQNFCKDGVLRKDLERDGLHLNDYGYMILTDRVKEKL